MTLSPSISLVINGNSKIASVRLIVLMSAINRTPRWLCTISGVSCRGECRRSCFLNTLHFGAVCSPSSFISVTPSPFWSTSFQMLKEDSFSSIFLALLFLFSYLKSYPLSTLTEIFENFCRNVYSKSGIVKNFLLKMFENNFSKQ